MTPKGRKKIIEHTIEFGIPIPPANVRRTQYPFARLTEVGMRFLLKRHGPKAALKLRHAAWEYGKRRGVKFVCRDLGRKGLACWRIK